MASVENCKQREIAEMKGRIISLEKELDHANDLLSGTKHRGEQ